MTLNDLQRLREQVDIRVDRLAKAKSKAYYTSPQWGGTGSGKTTEHSDRTAAGHYRGAGRITSPAPPSSERIL